MGREKPSENPTHTCTKVQEYSKNISSSFTRASVRVRSGDDSPTEAKSVRAELKGNESNQKMLNPKFTPKGMKGRGDEKKSFALLQKGGWRPEVAQTPRSLRME